MSVPLPNLANVLVRHGLTTTDAVLGHMVAGKLRTKVQLAASLKVGGSNLQLDMEELGLDWRGIRAGLVKAGLGRQSERTHKQTTAMGRADLCTLDAVVNHCIKYQLSTQKQIGESIGVTSQTIQQDLKRYGISWTEVRAGLEPYGLRARKPKLSQLPEPLEQILSEGGGVAAIAALCRSKKITKLTALARALGVGYERMLRRFHQAGIDAQEVQDEVALQGGEMSFATYWRNCELSAVVNEVIALRSTSLKSFCDQMGFNQRHAWDYLDREGLGFDQDILRPAALQAPERMGLALAKLSDDPEVMQALKQVGWAAVEEHARPLFPGSNRNQRMGIEVGSERLARLRADFKQS
ncbi:hypothetical protein [Ferrimonas marina]|nr:hypothetical protein [Ferrimonas marina]